MTDGKVASFRNFLEIIKGLNSDDEIRDFVLKRVELLEKDSQIDHISIYNEEQQRLCGNNFKGFIKNNCGITSSFMVDPFYMDDAEIYVEFIKIIKLLGDIHAIQLFYEFMNFCIKKFGFSGDQKVRENVYLTNSGHVSIKNFYNNGSALCSERSAVVQNLSEFCGVSSYYVLGKLKDNNTGDIQVHAYNIFKLANGKLLLFDVTNPVFLKNGYVPAFMPLDIESIDEVNDIDFDLNYLANLYHDELDGSEHERTYYTYKNELRDDSLKM